MLTENLPVDDSYLAGGTALSLIIGHRESVDFDWFSPGGFDPEKVSGSLVTLGRLEITETAKGTVHCYLNGVHISWLYYPNPLLAEILTTPDMPGLRVASLLDIGLMKWTAVSQRGARRDFIDLYQISREAHSLSELLGLLPHKYPGTEINNYHLIKSLSYFDDAEHEPMPNMLISLEWDEVKSYFLKAQKALLEKLGKIQ